MVTYQAGCSILSSNFAKVLHGPNDTSYNNSFLESNENKSIVLNASSVKKQPFADVPQNRWFLKVPQNLQENT